MPNNHDPNWINKLFSAKTVQRRGIVRRRAENVNKIPKGESILKNAVKRRKYHLLRIGDKEDVQYVVICNPGKMKVLC